MVFVWSCCSRGISRAQVSPLAKGSVYVLLPLVVPLLEKSSIGTCETKRTLMDGRMILTLVCYSFYETVHAHK